MRKAFTGTVILKQNQRSICEADGETEKHSCKLAGKLMFYVSPCEELVYSYCFLF